MYISSTIGGDLGRLGFEMDLFAVPAHDDRRGADHGAVGRNINHVNKSVGTDTGIVAYCDGAEYGRAGTDKNIEAESWMAFADMLAGAAQSDIMEQHAIIANNGGFTDDDAGTVIDKKPRSDPGTGMNFNPGEETIDLRQQSGDKGQFQIGQLFGKGVGSYGL